jgi:hypothetical protein
MGGFKLQKMTQGVSLITAAVVLSMSVTSQGLYIVTNAYEIAGCGGKLTQKASLSPGICVSAKQECGSNQQLQAACGYLKSLPVGDDISFIATCRGQQIVASVFKGAGCDQSQALGSLPVPVNSCLSDFKFACSDDPNYVIPNNSSESGASSATPSNTPVSDNLGSYSHKNMPGVVLGILGILGLFFA